MFVYPKLTCGNPNSQGDDVSRWGHWGVIRSGGAALGTGISAVTEGTPESSLVPTPPREDTGRRHVSLKQETVPHQTQICLDLGLPAS